MKPEVSIVIPAYNEEDRIVGPLDTILKYIEKSGREIEVIVVDDGSGDKTTDVANRIFAAWPQIATSALRYEPNRGKGYAIKFGLEAANADIALFTDADLSTPIDEMWKLIDPILAGNADLTFGSRALDRSLIGTHQSWLRENGGRVMNLIIRRMSGLEFADTQCGFKAFNLVKFRPLLSMMTIDRFGFDSEFLFAAQHNRLRLQEIPVRWFDVAGSKVSVLRDTRRMIGELNQIRRNSRRGVYDLNRRDAETQR